MNTNPLILNANGQFDVQVFANPSDVFSVEVKDVNDVVTEPTEDDIFFVSEFSLSSEDVAAAQAAYTGVVDLAGSGMVGSAFANFSDNLDLTAAGSIDASAGAITLGNVSGLTTFDSGLISTGNATINSGNLVIGTSGNGIDFSANTGAVGETAALLDWYEEGTFTPRTLFGGLETGVTYSLQEGNYTRIGDWVNIIFECVLSSKGTATGTAVIFGLPFAATVNSFGMAYCATITFADVVLSQINAAGTSVQFVEVTNVGVASILSDADFANNSATRVTMGYKA